MTRKGDGVLTIEQMQKLTGGALIRNKSPSDYDYPNIARSTINSTIYPTTFRLWTSGVKNQQDKGSCVAHACATMKETQEYYDTGDKHKFSVGWIYGFREDYHWQGEGMYIMQAMHMLKNYGAVLAKTLPDNLEYDDIQTIISDKKEECLIEGLKFKIKNYAGIDADNPNRASAIKSAIYNDKSPVVALFNVYRSFNNTAEDGIPPIPRKETDINFGGHAVAIIGWTTIGKTEYWVIQNSWGENFGDNGYFYIPIGKELEYDFKEFWCTIDITNYPIVFEDIKGRWSEKYIKKCIKAGLISGYDNGKFMPTDYLTREQICVILTKLMDKGL